jgi:hypothetical protein
VVLVIHEWWGVKCDYPKQCGGQENRRLKLGVYAIAMANRFNYGGPMGYFFFNHGLTYRMMPENLRDAIFIKKTQRRRMSKISMQPLS